MWKPQPITTMFKLRFRSKRLGKKTSQKQPPLVKTLWPWRIDCNWHHSVTASLELQLSDSKGFVFNHYAVLSSMCGCWDGKTALPAFHFQILQCTFPLLYSGRHFAEITKTSHWAALCIYFVFLNRERQQAREFKRGTENQRGNHRFSFFL